MVGFNTLHMALYVAAMCVSLTPLGYTLIMRRTVRPQNKLYVTLLAMIFINALSGIVRTLVKDAYAVSESARILTILFQYAYFLVHSIVPTVFFAYVMEVTSVHATLLRRLLIFILPACGCELLVISNPITHWIFSYDEGGVFHRGAGETFLYVFAAVYMFFSMYYLLFYWRAITVRKRIALVYFMVLTLIGVVLQLLFLEVKAELFAEALGLLGLMLAVEDEGDRIDADTGAYNRHALTEDLRNHLLTHQRFHVITVKITNSDMIKRITGSADTDILSQMVCEYLRTIVPSYLIYHPNPQTFLIICPQQMEEQAAGFVESLRERFEKEWICRNTPVMLNANVLSVGIPDRLKRVDEILFLADCVIPASVGRNEADVDYLLRRSEIQHLLESALEEHKFEVYYQPTYYLETLELHGAEALVRLQDDRIGFVSPEEFIPVAEQIGLIDEIDDFVLREVLAFLKSGEPSEAGLDCINVNLSVVQCLRPGFAEHILGIVDSYGVAHSQINFEITESAGAEDYEALKRVTEEFKKQGFTLSMDDYGTGYSNLDSIFALDFDVIKIDKSLLWTAERDEKGRIILENSIHMIRQMKRKVLVEGIETQDHVELLRRHHVDYLQGYYFSKPVPKNVLLSTIRGKKSVGEGNHNE